MEFEGLISNPGRVDKTQVLSELLQQFKFLYSPIINTQTQDCVQEQSSLTGMPPESRTGVKIELGAQYALDLWPKGFRRTTRTAQIGRLQHTNICMIYTYLFFMRIYIYIYIIYIPTMYHVENGAHRTDSTGTVYEDRPGTGARASFRDS